MGELKSKTCHKCGKEFEDVFKDQNLCNSCMDKIFENEKQMSKPIAVIEKIIISLLIAALIFLCAFYFLSGRFLDSDILIGRITFWLLFSCCLIKLRNNFKCNDKDIRKSKTFKKSSK